MSSDANGRSDKRVFQGRTALQSPPWVFELKPFELQPETPRFDPPSLSLSQLLKKPLWGAGRAMIVADLDGPRFQSVAQHTSAFPAGRLMHNAFGRLKPVSMRDVAERN